VLRAGPQHVAAHNCSLIEFMYRHLPEDRCTSASPLESGRRGPFGCFTARKPGRGEHRAFSTKQFKEVGGQLRPLVSFRTPHVTIPADNDFSRHILSIEQHESLSDIDVKVAYSRSNGVVPPWSK